MDKQKRLREIMKELRGENNNSNNTFSMLQKDGGGKEMNNSMIQYHRPYINASGEKFHLPKKWWHLNNDGQQWQECDVDYSFKKDEMNGGDLIHNLCWLGNSGKLMKLVKVQSISSDKDDNDDTDDANNKGYRQDNDLVGCGVPSRGRKRRDSFKEDRNIYCALLEMDNTLSNWTLHGQNWGRCQEITRDSIETYLQIIAESSVISLTQRLQCWIQLVA